jgi:predicted Fe-Mo cluster-binding NifX family protein
MCIKTVTLTGESNDDICSENFGEAENVTIYSINEANLRVCPHIELTVGEMKIIGLIDKGAEESLISE